MPKKKVSKKKQAKKVWECNGCRHQFTDQDGRTAANQIGDAFNQVVCPKCYGADLYLRIPD